MSADQDMVDCEYRNEFGRPWASNGSAVVNSPVDNSVNKPMPWIALAMLIAGVAIVLAIWARSEAAKAERETRMLEYYLLELDAKFIAAGLKPAEESISKKLDRGRETSK